MIKGAPVIHGADEALEGLTGFLDGPGGMALERIGLVACLALAALGVSLQQVDEVVGIFALGFNDQWLGVSAAKDITAKKIARHELGGRIAHGLQALQAEGELC